MNKQLERKLLAKIRKTTLQDHERMLVTRDGNRGLLIDNVFILWSCLTDKIKTLLTIASYSPNAWKEFTGACFLFSDEKSAEDKYRATLENYGAPKFPSWNKTMNEVKEPELQISAVSDIVGKWIPKYLPAEREAFVILVVAHDNSPLHAEYFSVGTNDQTAVYPREVMTLVLKHRGTGFLAIHNHPSGQTNPSQADRSITRDMQIAAKALDIRLLDHLIIGKETNGKTYFSFREHGLLS